MPEKGSPRGGQRLLWDEAHKSVQLEDAWQPNLELPIRVLDAQTGIVTEDVADVGLDGRLVLVDRIAVGIKATGEDGG